MIKWVTILSCSALFLSGCMTLKVASYEKLVDFRNGNEIHLRKGRFVVEEPLIFPNGSRVIGNNTTLLSSDENFKPIIKVHEANSIALVNLEILGLGHVISEDKILLERANYNYAIDIFNSKNIEISNCKFSKLRSTVVKILDSDLVRIVNCSFKDIGFSTYKNVGYSYDGVYVGGKIRVSNILIESCEFENIGTVFANGNPPWPNDGDGVHVLSDGQAENIKIVNNRFINCSARGVKVQTGLNVLIEKNFFNKCWSAINLAIANSVSDVKIIGNEIGYCNFVVGTDGNLPSAIANEITIKNNYVKSCDYFLRTSGVSEIVESEISKNRIDFIRTYFAIGRFKRVDISNNTILEYATSNDKSFNMAILIEDGSDEVRIMDNLFVKGSTNAMGLINRCSGVIINKNNRFKEKE